MDREQCFTLLHYFCKTLVLARKTEYYVSHLLGCGNNIDDNNASFK